jgi:hypothetical protein
LILSKDKRLEANLKPGMDLSVIEDKYEIVAFERFSKKAKTFELEIIIQQQRSSYVLFSK